MTLQDWKPQPLEYKTAIEFAWYVCKHKFLEVKFREKFDLKTDWPCFQCKGAGYISEYTGVGNDYFDKNCYDCQNTGKWTKERFMTLYRTQRESHARRISQYRIDLSVERSIRKKLTNEEIQFLKNHQLS
jgi:DnaJ-class molecular chaperone